MATIVLSAAGMALGSSIGGSFLGLGAATIGRAVGAAVGRSIDQRLLGAGSDPVETGRVDRFRLTGASEGAPIQRLHGRSRIGGQVIWATEFLEDSEAQGGKGFGNRPKTVEFSYTVSLAIALCEGVITDVGRVWADGVEVAPDDLNMRVYTGAEDQLPDPRIEAVEGAGAAPAYRGTAYVVLEDLPLGQFGNRVPQFTFEVSRPAQPGDDVSDMTSAVRAVALMPGSGEYALATTAVVRELGFGEAQVVNVNSASAKSDIETSLDQLTGELPQVTSVSLIVSWFGDDLRCGSCQIRPKVEHKLDDPEAMPWEVAGVDRDSAEEIAQVDGRPVYGGTPADASVREAIAELQDRDLKVVYYPFILMEQLEGNGLPDPYSDATDQPPLPWRGRITLDDAPGRPGTTDQTAAAATEVSAFFGTASASDFAVSPGSVTYTGPAEWSYRRFILHQAALCASAGGVDAFCIGSEMVALTTIRGAGNSFPAVDELIALAAECRTLLGPSVKIGYAADWTEYFGYQPGDGDRFFHLDPLWADDEIGFVGIDNYMPLSDWRDGTDHLDFETANRSIYDLDYLFSNVAGGEGYDWYYDTPEAREAQDRTPITDAAHGEPWVWRYKDLRNWWRNAHHERIGGVRQTNPTAWVPESKPVWFTEIGCASVDKGTNQPNKFLDPKSSESKLPYHSNGLKDELIQMQYVRAFHAYWGSAANNPISSEYGGYMVDPGRIHVWAWDARPYPTFPNASELWSDGANHGRGHWITGRASARPLAAVVTEICREAGLHDIDVSRLHGLVRGYMLDSVTTGRAALQPLMLAFGFDAVERDGVLTFATRDGVTDAVIPQDSLAVSAEIDTDIEAIRAPEAEIAGRVRVNFFEAGGDYEVRASEAVFADEETTTVSQTDLPLVMSRAEGARMAERWLAEARLSRDAVRLTLPPSQMLRKTGDVIELPGRGPFRIDRLDLSDSQQLEAVRVNPETYLPHLTEEETASLSRFVPPVPVVGTFLDLPLITGDEVEHAPHFAATARPWPGSVALYASDTEDNFVLDGVFTKPALIGVTETAMVAAAPALVDRGPALRVRLVRGSLSSRSFADLLGGANLAAIGDGSTETWELFQFADVAMVGPRTFELATRLRGQAGTDGVMPEDWPIGSRVVILNGVPRQILLASNQRNVLRHYRHGPALRAVDDPSYRAQELAFRGIGLRPYSPCHLRAVASGGGLDVTWVRRTRLDGDSWNGLDVPLGEAQESYLVRVERDGQTHREAVVSTAAWTYGAAAQNADGLSAPYEIAVAQVSDRFGPGPFERLTIAG